MPLNDRERAVMAAMLCDANPEKIISWVVVISHKCENCSDNHMTVSVGYDCPDSLAIAMMASGQIDICRELAKRGE